LLHDVLTNHVEFVEPHSAQDTHFHSSASGISCKCENLFAQPVFIVSSPVLEISSPAVFPSPGKPRADKFYSFHRFFFELRGPPVEATV